MTEPEKQVFEKACKKVLGKPFQKFIISDGYTGFIEYWKGAEKLVLPFVLNKGINKNLNCAGYIIDLYEIWCESVRELHRDYKRNGLV